MKYILKGCFSARGFERIKDGDEIPVGWFDELTIDKMIKKGTIVVIQPKQEKQEIIEEIETEMEMEIESKDEIFENKKKGIRKK
jgi:hypothetical protein